MKKKILLLAMLFLTAFSFNVKAQTAGDIDPTFNPTDIGFKNGDGVIRDIYATAIQSDGKIIIGGYGTYYNGIAINRIARLNADGSLDATFNTGTGANNLVGTIAIQNDGKIIIGGDFTSYSGTEINRIARLNADGTLDITFNPGTGADNIVYTTAIQSDGKIIIGGKFTSFNGTVINRIARLNEDGTLDATFNSGTGASSYVYTTTIQSDGKIIIGGNFNSYNGTSKKCIARLNEDGTLDATFNPGTGANNYVYTTTIQSDGKIIIGGDFTSYNGTARNRIARLNSNGTLDVTFNPGTGANNLTRSTVIQSDGKIIIGGSFTSFNGTIRNGIVRVKGDGTLDATFNLGFEANYYVLKTVLQSDGKTINVGYFTGFNGTLSFIARLDADGKLDATFNPQTGANDAVLTTIVQSDGKIIIGGQFFSYNGTSRNGIVRVNEDGTLDPTFNPGMGANNYIYTTSIQSDGKIIIGGDFTSYNGTARNRIARLNDDGTLDVTFNPGFGANNTVRTTVMQSDGKIIIGGDFTSYNGTTRNHIARLNTDGTIDATFNLGTGANYSVYTTAIQNNGKIIIGGGFNTYNDIAINHIARLNADGTLDNTFNPGMGVSNAVYTTAIQNDGKIIVGGEFTSFNSTLRNHIARLNADGLLDETFNPQTGANYSVNTTALQSDGKIIIGGNFTSYNGKNRAYIVRLNTDGTSDINFNLGTGADNSVNTIAIQSDGKIIIGGNYSSYNGTGRNRIARLLGCIPLINVGTITGESTICQGQTSVNYTVPINTNAESYVWTLPSGATGTSTTNSISVDFGASTTSGNITVKGTNSCGDGPTSTFPVTVNPLPASAGIINGAATVCQGQNAVTYTVPVIADATTYVWIVPSGVTGTSTTNSITVDFGTSAASGNITVKGTNSCGDGETSTFAVIVNPLPGIAGVITGKATVCQGENPVTYTIPSIALTTSFVWTLPTGVSGTSTTNSITVDFGTSATSGYITVKGNNSCGVGETSTFAVTVNPLPASAGIITGAATVCQGQNAVTYTVPTIADATSYVWTVPNGAIGTSTTNSISVDFGTSATSGDITVKGINSCGDGETSTFAVTVNPLPASAGIITGAATVCQGQNAVTYTVPTIADATSYVWTLPTGATGTSTTNSISVDFGTSATSGDITVKGTNSCGNGPTSTFAVTINPLPENAGIITGTATVCQGHYAVTYTVSAIADVTSYIWTLPTGATGTSTINSITVDFGTLATSGDITVKGTNSCGDGETSTFAVTVNPLPASAGIITGTATVCQGQNAVTYTVPTIADATSYVWTLPTGATGTSTTNSITVDFGTSAISGDITVKGTNSCGDGVVSTFAVTVNPLPESAGTINGTATVCQDENAITYTVPAIADATSYVWSLPSGATGTSTTNSISVDFGTSATSGDITVKGTNSCGDGVVSTFAVTVNPLPASAGTISGAATVCQGENAITYTVPAIADATLYVWSLPSSATGTSTTNSISVDFGTSATSGNITVKGTNSCGDGEASTFAITVNPLPASAGIITGTATVCPDQNAVSYTLPTIADATSYVWTLPTGATGTSTTNSITVDFGTSATSGNITVKGINSCGDGETSTFAVTVNPLPASAGIITGTATVCQGENSVIYTVPAIENATSYVWTLPTGATGTSTTNSITVDYGIIATSGDITVNGTNTCGDGETSLFAVTVNGKPTTPVITLNGNVLHSDAPAGNQWYDQSSLINGATNQDYTVIVNGDYYTIVTLLGCSSDASNTLNVIVDGIEDVENNKTFNVYPNPVSNELVIGIEGNNGKLNFEILNATGQIVYKGNLVEKAVIVTSNFAPGVYLIKLENGETFEFKKIIKE